MAGKIKKDVHAYARSMRYSYGLYEYKYCIFGYYFRELLRKYNIREYDIFVNIYKLLTVS